MVFWLFTIKSVLLIISPNAWTCNERKLSPWKIIVTANNVYNKSVQNNQGLLTIWASVLVTSAEQFGLLKSASSKIFTSRQNTVGKVSKMFWLYLLKDVSFFLVLVTDLKGKPLTRCEDHPQTFRLSIVNSYAALVTNCPNFGPYTKCIITKSNNLSCHLNK